MIQGFSLRTEAKGLSRSHERRRLRSSLEPRISSSPWSVARCSEMSPIQICKERVRAFTNAVLGYPLLPRFLLLTAFEWGSQCHYVESVRDREGDRSDRLYVDMLKYHWIEENQHTKTDVLEIARMAASMTPHELTETFDQLQGIAALVDETFVGQVEAELATFQTVTGHKSSESQAEALDDRLLGTMRVIWADVGLTHPSFKRMALDLSKKGAAKMGITET